MNIIDKILATLNAAGTASPLSAAGGISVTNDAPTLAAGGEPMPAPVPDINALAAPSAAPPHGVLGAISSILAPQPGSFWHSAMKNGLWDARGGMERYPYEMQQLQDKTAAGHEAALQAPIATQQAAENLEDDRRDEVNLGGTGGIAARGEDGQYHEVYRPAPQPTEAERLIDKWTKLPPGPLKDLYERAIRGYQYTPEFLDDKLQRDEQLAGERARLRPAPRGRSGSGRPARSSSPGSGFNILP